MARLPEAPLAVAVEVKLLAPMASDTKGPVLTVSVSPVVTQTWMCRRSVSVPAVWATPKAVCQGASVEKETGAVKSPEVKRTTAAS